MKKQMRVNRRTVIKGIGGAALSALCGSYTSFAKSADQSRSAYKVFSPGKIGGLKLKNRIIKAATATEAILDDGRFLHEGYEIYRNWSKGGAAMIISGHTTVAPIAENAFPHNLNRLYDDAYIPQVKKIADAVHAADSKCKIIVQLNHIGNHPLMKTPGIGPSDRPWPGQKHKPGALSADGVRKIIDSFTDAAMRAKKAGFDGVEIHAAHSFLLHSFLTPLTNTRTDEYGGSMKNRVAIIREMVQKIKSSAGAAFPVLIKVNTYDAGGIDINNFPELAAEIASTGVDAIELSGGKPALPDIDDPTEQSYHAKYAKKIKVGVPVILTGGNKSIDVVERLFRPGTIDFFGFARALIREPDLPNRWLNKNADAECACISCNACIHYYVLEGHKLLRCLGV